MSNFSVKKPYTIFVGVMIVILLGVISFSKLSTDLLPKIELPYVAIITSYVGASPEKVEESVSKVIEQGMMGISNIKNVTSTSSENYSMVLLEFSGNSNMDSVMIEISQKLDELKANFEEGISTPVVMQINPDMMPVLMSAIDIENSDSSQITDFVQNTLISELESVEGVATVSTYGAVEEEIVIKLDQEKINNINDKLLENISSELMKQKSELDKAKIELHNGKNTLKNTKNEKGKQIAEGLTALENGRNEITKTEVELNSKEEEANSKKQELENQLNTLDVSKSEFDKQKQLLTDKLEELKIEKTKVENQKNFLENRKIELEEKQNNGLITLEESNELTEIPIQILTIDASLEGFKTLENTMNYGIDQINSKSAELENGKSQIVLGIEQINNGLNGIIEARNVINSKKEELNATDTNLKVAQNTLLSETTLAEANINSAEKELEEGIKKFESARDEAFKKASLEGIITADLVANILKAENFSMPAGYINDDIIVKVGDKFSNIDEIKNLVLFSFDIDGLREITLQDLASIEIKNNSDDVYTKMNKNNGLILSFSKQSTSSTKDVSKAIQKKFKQLEQKYDNIKFTNLMDQGIYIDMIIGSVMQSLIVGGILAIIVLFLFLKELKPTIVVAFSIPISLVFAIAMMYFSGVSINIMSLSGLALGVGMLVDNSIVVIENIYRLRKEGMPIKEAAVEGAKKVTGAIISSTLTTICVFMPILFVEGLSRQLFTDIGLTIAYSLVASLIIALTVVPAMASKLLKKVSDKENKFITKLTKIYIKILKVSLKFKIVVIIIVVVLLGSSIYLTTKMEIEFVPKVSSNEMSINVIMPKENTFEEKKNKANIIIDRLLTIEEIDKIGALDMSNTTSILGGANSEGISMYIILKDDKKNNNEEIAEKIKELTSDLDCQLDISTSNMDMSAMMASGISIKIKGTEISKLREIGINIEEKLRSIEGIGEIEGLKENSVFEKHIQVDKNKAMKYNLTVAQVYQEVANRLKKEANGSKIELDSKEYQVIIQKSDEDKINLENMMNIELDGKENQEDVKVKLSNIAVVEDATGLENITRENNNRYLTITASIDENASMTEVSRKVEKLLKNYKTPEGYTVEIEGELNSIMEYIMDLVLMITVAIIFIYLIMVSQFQSFKLPFIVMFTMPLAFTGGLLTLFFTGQTINIIAMLGFLVLAGIVVNNGIVFIDCINQLRQEGFKIKDAILKTGELRLRPILMTALTTILGLLSMALGIGEGSEMTKPLGIVAIGGLVYSTLLTLFLVPILYEIFCKKDKVDIN